MEMPVSCTSLPLAGVVVPIYSPGGWLGSSSEQPPCLPRLLCPQWCLAHPGSLCGNVLPGAWQPRVHRAHDGQDARGRDLGNAVIYGVGDEVDPYYAVGGGATDEEAPR